MAALPSSPMTRMSGIACGGIGGRRGRVEGAGPRDLWGRGDGRGPVGKGRGG
jgi:hypothetical protein